MRFPASYTFDTRLKREEHPITVWGDFEDEWQFVLNSVAREDGTEITGQLTKDEIADLEAEGSLKYGEYLADRAEAIREAREDR